MENGKLRMGNGLLKYLSIPPPLARFDRSTLRIPLPFHTHYPALDNPTFLHNIEGVSAGALIRSLPSSAVKRPPLAARTAPKGAAVH